MNNSQRFYWKKKSGFKRLLELRKKQVRFSVPKPVKLLRNGGGKRGKATNATRELSRAPVSQL